MVERQSGQLSPQGPENKNRIPSLLTTDILSVARSVWPDRVAIKFGDISVTYEELFRDATKIAHGLSGMGVVKEDRVAVLSGNSPEYVETIFAIALAGAQLVPLNFRSTPEQIVHMFNTVNAKVVFYADRNRPSVQAVRGEINPDIKLVSFETKMEGEISFQDLMSHGEEDEIDTSGIADTDVAVIMFTSGTTSLPKAVEQPHSSFTESLSFPEDPEKHATILVTTPLFHVAALQGIFASVVEGRTMVLLPDFRPESLLQALSAGVERATLVPTQIEQIINHSDFSKYDLSQLRQITYGGSHMPLPVILEAMKKLPEVAFVRAYGLTETGGTVAVMGSDGHKITGHETEDELRKKYYALTYGIGKPVDGVKITIVDDLGNEIPPREEEEGVMGRITIETSRVMQGYLGQQRETSEVLEGKRFITQDLGWTDKEGNTYLIGRVDDMIIRGGEKIPPAEIETTLLNHPAIADAVAIGVPDKEWGQVVAAVVSLKPGAQATQEEIIEFCKKTLGSSKTPARIVITEQLPRNALGKLVRRDLKQFFVVS